MFGYGLFITEYRCFNIICNNVLPTIYQEIALFFRCVLSGVEWVYYVTNKTLPVCSYYSLVDVVNLLTIVLISPSADTIVPATTGIMLINMANDAVSVYLQRNILVIYEHKVPVL